MYIFFCLFNPTINDQEGDLYFTNVSKTWKISLNEKADAFREKLKNKKTMELGFQLNRDDNDITFVHSGNSNDLGLESTGDSQGKFEKYDLLVLPSRELNFYSLF